MSNITSVCIVEDVRDIREALERIIGLSPAFGLTGSFATGEEALRKLPVYRPKIVLTDIGLGSMSGIELVEQLKPRFPEMLFMMCTIYEEEDKIFDALRAGASGYILKKSSPAKILDSLKELLEGGAPMTNLIARKVVTAFKEIPLLEEAPELEEHGDVAALSKREKEILECLAEGKIYKEIALEMNISPETVRKHVYHIYEKLQVNNRMSAVNKLLGR
jgi:DNA-binding NarL/FixJ family response regulator